MKRLKRLPALLLAVLFLMNLSGCYSGNIDQYMSLPQPADEYLQLQDLIDEEIAAGCEYAAPTKGSFRQSVQLHDLNGDGVEEAIVFFRNGSQSLQINIYTPVNNSFRKVLTLEGEGQSIGSVIYADVDRDDHQDMIVSWQIASNMSILSVYSLANWTGELMLTSDCTEFLTGDLNRDGGDELMVIRSVGTGAYLADMYTFNAREPQATSAVLSARIYELRRLRVVDLADSVPALMAESILDNGDLVTDLLVCREGSLVNLTLNRSTGISETRRSYSLIYSQDIDGDGVTEMPRPQQLYSQSSEVFWSIAWYNYDSFGRTYPVMTTYHCVSDSWYLRLPSGWETGLTIRRDDSVPGERAVILSRLGTDGEVHDLLAVYTITGENRSERAKQDGRFLLLEDNAVVYAGEALSPEVDRNAILNRFHRIYSEWST